MSDPLPHQKKPCKECPWRKDTPSGQFTAERYEALRNTTGSPGKEADLNSPIFACHKTQEGREAACAGWLAAVGIEHLGIRFAIIQNRLPADSLKPKKDWPELHSSYEEMKHAKSQK
jgi:hypothetical protein